jgi:hypothetical protein
MISIWFSDADDDQNVKDSLLQNLHVDSNPKQSSGMTFYTSWEYYHLRNKAINNTKIAWIQTELWEQKDQEIRDNRTGLV